MHWKRVTFRVGSGHVHERGRLGSQLRHLITQPLDLSDVAGTLCRCHMRIAHEATDALGLLCELQTQTGFFCLMGHSPLSGLPLLLGKLRLLLHVAALHHGHICALGLHLRLQPLEQLLLLPALHLQLGSAAASPARWSTDSGHHSVLQPGDLLPQLCHQHVCRLC
jgi:hypothetical protein